jgi:hypothetical protein
LLPRFDQPQFKAVILRRALNHVDSVKFLLSRNSPRCARQTGSCFVNVRLWQRKADIG